MEIITNSRYIDPAKQHGESWYVLEVVNKHDLETKVICTKKGLCYSLKKNTPTEKKDSWTSEVIEVPNEEQRSILTEKGYNLIGSTEQWHLSVIDAMCTETLNPDLGAKWDEIKANLILLRKNL